MKRGKSASFLRALRKKYALGEFKNAGRRKRASRFKTSSRSAHRRPRKSRQANKKSSFLGFLPDHDTSDVSYMRSKGYIKALGERGNPGSTLASTL